MEFKFLLINAHFVLNLLAALVCFATSWLYCDSWANQKDYREGTKSLGFFLLTLSFLVQSTIIENNLLQQPILGAQTLHIIVNAARIIGYSILIIGELIDPIQPLPSYRSKSAKTVAAVTILNIPTAHLFPFVYPILASVAAFLYLRKATVGLENHLKPISWSLFILAIKDIASLSATFRDTNNIDLLKIVEPYGPIWIFENILLFIAMFILGKWVWSYLIKRLETQLFMVFTSGTLFVFLVTAIFFTSVSLANLRKDVLQSLEINAKVLQYSLESKKSEMLSNAQVISQNTDLISATKNQKHSELANVTAAMLLTKKQSTLTVVDKNGAVLIKAEDPEKIGGSLSDDPLIKKAFANEETSDIITKEGVIAPEISIRAAAPIFSNGEIIGAVLIGTIIDNAFLDGLKSSTGLDASLYADTVRSATTFISSDGKSRWVGVKESSQEIQKTVLTDNAFFSGSTDVLNVPYLAVYAPINDINKNPIGMLFVGRTQVSILQAATALIEQTFLVTAMLLVFSIAPSFMISKYIISQI